MSLSLDQSSSAEFLRFLARFTGVSTASAARGPVRIRVGKSTDLYQPTAIARALARQADREDELCGASPLEIALVAQWLDVSMHAISDNNKDLLKQLSEKLEQRLQTRTYVAAERVTLADAALFWALRESLVKMKAGDKKNLPNVCRWFDQVQHTAGVRGFRDMELVQFERKPFVIAM